MFLTILAALGLTYIIVESDFPPLVKLRKFLTDKQKEAEETKRESPFYYSWFLELITCYQCSGFWSGVILGLILQPLSYGFDWWFWNALAGVFVFPIVTGLICSFVAHFSVPVINWFNAPLNNYYKK